MLRGIRPHLQRYGVAVLAVAIALLIKLLLTPVIQEESPFLLFFAAVMASTLYGGKAAGVLATVLAALVSHYFFLEPYYSFAINSFGQGLRLGIFVLEGILLARTIGALKSTQERVKLGQQALSQSEERYRLLIDAVPDYAIFMLAPDGRIASWNKGAQAIKGYRADEIIGQHFSCFYPESDIQRGKPEHELQVAAAVGRFEEEGWRVRKDGSCFWANVVITALRDEAGNLNGFSKVTRDISDRKQVEAELRLSEARFRMLLENVKDYAIFLLDTDARVVRWSAGAENILGYQEAEILGQPGSVIFTPEDLQRGADKEELNKAVTESRAEDERWHVRKDGTRFWASGIMTSLRDETGQLQGFAKIMRDFTERKRADEERDRLLAGEQEARTEAERANRMKDEFLATLSHELRTPLNAMLGWTNLLRTRKFDETTKARALETIDRNTKSLAQLIEDVLDVSRIITGKLRLQVGSIELVPVIQAALETVLPAAEAKQIQIESILDPSVKPILGDANRLQQVVWNLLSNAVKFTPKGGRVEVRLEGINSRVQMRVIDTGQGINPDFLPYVFDRFRQADSSITRSHGGLGLGLAIVRHLVELHGGTVQAESPGLGNGATFIVNLPIRAIRVKASEKEQVQPTLSTEEVLTSCPPALDGLQVLVVDDEPDARDLLSTVLGEYRAEVITVASAGEALEALKQLQPNVLVSDIGMPGEDGYALIRQVRALDAEQGGRIPAVALTAYARTEDRKQVLLAGFQLHVPKPVDPAELAAAIANLTGRTGKL